MLASRLSFLRFLAIYFVLLVFGHDIPSSRGFTSNPNAAAVPLMPTWRQNINAAALPSTKLNLYRDNSNDENGDDWRDFRAKLVMQSKDESSSGNFSSGWVYESGDAIEKGSLLLASPEQDFGMGLKQQYFHKSLVFIIYHEELAFTKGIILNRPTDLVLGDNDFVDKSGMPLKDSKPGRNWKIWYGGDVFGIDSEEPQQICLHSLTSESAKDISENILKDISWTTMSGARKLVHEGHATADDFIVFCGYAGWSPGQLANEIGRKSWYTLQADDKILLDEIRSTAKYDAKDPERAGVDCWNKLMNLIGKDEEAKSSADCFDDLMLREFAKKRLIFRDRLINTKSSDDRTEMMLERAKNLDTSIIGPGTIIRSSSNLNAADEEPFLLDDQEFLESVALIIQDDDFLTVGVILNLPSAHSVDIEISTKDDAGDKATRTISVPQRYGGKFGLKGQSTKPTVWLHRSKKLQEAKVGSPFGSDDSNIWICTQDDVEVALGIENLASADDFLAINGFTVWEKAKDSHYIGGLEAEVLTGNFEISDATPDDIWKELMSAPKGILTEGNFEENLKASQTAWLRAGGTTKEVDGVQSNIIEKAKKAWTSVLLLSKSSLRN